MKALILILAATSLLGCTLHVCGNNETAQQVGNGEIGEQQQNEDKATADVKVPVKPK